MKPELVIRAKWVMFLIGLMALSLPHTTVGQTHPDPESLLYGRFGVQLQLQPAHGGHTLPSFLWESFAPTKNIETVDWIESDWYGTWNLQNWNYSTIRHTSADGSDEDWYPSGGERYDVEALYFDNDDDYFYVVVVTSVPHYRYYPEIDSANVGIYEPRFPAWVIPGDLSINLFKGIPHQERYNTVWYYDYGVDVVHDNRDKMLVQAGARTPDMRDFNIGNKLYKTTNDTGGGDSSTFPENPYRLSPNSDWYVGSPKSATTGHWEHTNFDPFSQVSQNLGIQYIGDVQTRVTELFFLSATGDTLHENGAPTYAWEFIIPRSLFGDDNPGTGDLIGLQWVEGCRNDGNNTSGVVNIGDIDGMLLDFGDAPAPYPTTLALNAGYHIIQNNMFLGSHIDAELNGNPSDFAAGDDNSGATDDEDGVSFSGVFEPFSTVGISITASINGILDAWIDFNGDGDWLDAGEKIFNHHSLSAGSHNLTITVPDAGYEGISYARFRFSAAGCEFPHGLASSGEVEDYRITILPRPSLDLGVEKTVDQATPAEGESSVFTMTVTNLSETVTATQIVYLDTLPAAFAYLDSDATMGTYNPANGHWNIPSLSPGASAVLSITVQADTSADNRIVLLSLDQIDTNPNNNEAWASITVTGSSGGNTGGLESNGNLASLIAQRNHERLKNGTLNRYNHPEDMLMFSENLAGTGIIRAAGSLKSSTDLAAYIPEEGPFNTQAFISTPEDLLGASNASEVISVDYFDQSDRRLAAILAITTREAVYNHTKLICDRLTGARLENTTILNIRDHSFILGKLTQPNGDVDYAISFIAYQASGHFIIDNRWHNEEFNLPPATDILNFQVWSATMQSTIELVELIFNKLEEETPLFINTAGQPLLPKVYVTNGHYENGFLSLSLNNTSGASRATISGTLTHTEHSPREPFSYTVPIDPSIQYPTISVPTGFIFDIGFSLANDYDLMRDGLYFADGPWGLDYEHDKTSVTSYTVFEHDGSEYPGTLLLERNISLTALTTSYISVFRSFRPGRVAVDLSPWNTIAFDAMGSEETVQLTLSNPGIESWSDQFRTQFSLGPQWTSYRIPFEAFNSTNNSLIFAPDNLLSAAFSIRASGQLEKQVNFQIRNLRFEYGSTGLGQDPASPFHWQVIQNPFAGDLMVLINQNGASPANLTLHDLGGRELSVLFSGDMPPGPQHLHFNLNHLDQGIYLLRYQTNQQQQSIRISLVK